MIQNGIHFSPILGQNQFELQNPDSSIGLDSLSQNALTHNFFIFTKPGHVDAKSSRIIYRVKTG